MRLRQTVVTPCTVCGATMVHDLDPESVVCGRCVIQQYAPKPPPTTEYRNMGSTPYRLGMLILVVGCSSAGFIIGFLVRG